MAEIAEFLTKRYVEDLKVAERAKQAGAPTHGNSASWTARHEPYGSYVSCGGQWVNRGVRGYPDMELEDDELVVIPDEFPRIGQAAHIAHFDPERMWKDSLAKMLLLTSIQEAVAAEEELETVLKPMTAPYKDHEDWKPRWEI